MSQFLKKPSIEVENAVKAIAPENVVAKFDYGNQHDVTIPVIVEHGEEIEAGDNKITLKVAESAGDQVTETKIFISNVLKL